MPRAIRGFISSFSALSLVLAVLASAGCSSKGKPGAVDRVETGGVQVVVHDLSDEERVTAMQVTLTPLSAGAPLVRELPTPAPGQPWSATLAALPAGSYTATAEAFDAGSQPLFESAASAPFVVQLGSTPQVNLFLIQRPVDPPFVAPSLSAINFLTEPEAGQSTTIVVRGEGGEGVLELSGSGDGVFSASTGDAKAPVGASIQWTPGGSGPRNILLVLEDEAGNRAAHVLTVVVPGSEGSVDFTVYLNHAPYATTVATSTTSATSTVVELRTTFRDDAIGQIDYAWDFSACDAAGLLFDPNGDSATGAAPRDGERIFRLQATDGQARSCVALLELSDRGAGPAVQRQTLSIHTEYLEADCEPGLSACFGVCTDTLSDREHCGACYNICGLGENCEDGSCVQVCAAGLAYCDGDCVDLDSDPAFCGDCQTACSPDQICNSGACACPGGWLTCDSLCTDISTSNTHCGACDNTCTGGQQCDAGSCACPSPLINCGGTCVDLDQDAGNCGSCGNTCAAGQHCAGGGCACDTPGLSACGALCVDFQTDPAHCGGCGPSTACATGETCESGQCIAAGCPAGQDACGPGGACVDITENASHCGGCNQACNTYDPCVNSVCMPDPEWANWPLPPIYHSNYAQAGGMVTDNYTNLVWQQSLPAGAYTWENAKQYCRGINLGGFKDWRLPTRIELISIVAEGLTTSGAAVNQTYFPGTPNQEFWTASTFASNGTMAWYIDAQWGDLGADGKAQPKRVRCVRYGSGYRAASELSPRYVSMDPGGVSGDPYVLDTRTNLRWRRAGACCGTQPVVTSFCAGKVLGGKAARMPSRKEMASLVDVRKSSNIFDTNYFGGNVGYYWTSTAWDYCFWNFSSACYFQLNASNGGEDFSFAYDYEDNVRCVTSD